MPPLRWKMPGLSGGGLLQAGYQPEPMRVDTITGKAMFFVKDPDGLPIEIHE